MKLQNYKKFISIILFVAFVTAFHLERDMEELRKEKASSDHQVS